MIALALSRDQAELLYKVIISTIFLVVALLFLFPSNAALPLDRRVAGLLGAALCTVAKWAFDYFYHFSPADTLADGMYNPAYLIDHSVLLILVAIMIVNYIIIRQSTISKLIRFLQESLHYDFNLGYWLLCFSSFAISPFITNDGLCLLLIDPVLDAFLPEFKLSNDAGFLGWYKVLSCPLYIFGGRPNAPNSGVVERSIADDLKISQDHKTNRFFLLLGIACSANYGSALTFTGNPQNIIISMYLSRFIKGYEFFYIMLFPCLLCWLCTMLFINSCRVALVQKLEGKRLAIVNDDHIAMNPLPQPKRSSPRKIKDIITSVRNKRKDGYSAMDGSELDDEDDRLDQSVSSGATSVGSNISAMDHLPLKLTPSEYTSLPGADSPRSRQNSHSVPAHLFSVEDPDDDSDSSTIESDDGGHRRSSVDSAISMTSVTSATNFLEESPKPTHGLQPYQLIGSNPPVAFFLFFVLIVLQFLSIFPLVAVYLMVAIFMLCSVVLANYYCFSLPDHDDFNSPGGDFETSSHGLIASEGHDIERGLHPAPSTAAATKRLSMRQRKIEYITQYIEDVFLSIDYNLLIIFIGLFIVAGSMVETRIPAVLWTVLAGPNTVAFQSIRSVALISAYTIVCSQLVGNVALVVMASGQVRSLDRDVQIFGWYLLAWVSTIAGNFTLPGSAANIIVAEKSMRHKAGVYISSIHHGYYCSVITLIGIVVGVAITYYELTWFNIITLQK